MLAVAALSLSACGKKEDSTTVVDEVTEQTTTATEITTGSAECTPQALGQAVASWGQSQGEKASLPSGQGSYQCADGWAVAFPNVGGGQAEVTVTVVFEAEGPTWVPQNRAKICGKDSPVPKSLYQDACQSN